MALVFKDVPMAITLRSSHLGAPSKNASTII